MSLRLVITILVPCCWEKKEERRGREGEHEGVMEVNPVSVKLYPELLTEITGTPGTVIIIIIIVIITFIYTQQGLKHRACGVVLDSL